jgi:predicted nuclease of predicted toxin-antitoxin system
MNFLIDANLPRRIVRIFQERGHDAVHTLDLPEGNATADVALLNYAEENNCVVTSKDSDFSTSFWLQESPQKLLLISTGNIRNAELETLLIANFDQLISALTENRFIELTREHMIVHA